MVGAGRQAAEHEVLEPAPLKDIERHRDVAAPLDLVAVALDFLLALSADGAVAQPGEIHAQRGDPAAGEVAGKLDVEAAIAVMRVARRVADHHRDIAGLRRRLAEDAEQVAGAAHPHRLVDPTRAGQRPRLGHPRRPARRCERHPGAHPIQQRRIVGFRHCAAEAVTQQFIGFEAGLGHFGARAAQASGIAAHGTAPNRIHQQHMRRRPPFRESQVDVGQRVQRRVRQPQPVRLQPARLLRRRPPGEMSAGLQHPRVGDAGHQRRQHDQRRDVIARRGLHCRHRGAEPQPAQHDALDAGRVTQMVGRPGDAFAPGGQRVVARQVTGVAGVGVIEAQGRVAGARQPVGQHAQREVRAERFAAQAGADQHADIAGRLVQPAETAGEGGRGHAGLPCGHKAAATPGGQAAISSP